MEENNCNDVESEECETVFDEVAEHKCTTENIQVLTAFTNKKFFLAFCHHISEIYCSFAFFSNKLVKSYPRCAAT